MPLSCVRLALSRQSARHVGRMVDVLESPVRDTFDYEVVSGADDCVAALNVRREESERLPWLERLHPETHVTQFDGHRVDVDPIDAAADNVAQSRTSRRGRGFVAPRAHRGKPLRDPVSG